MNSDEIMRRLDGKEFPHNGTETSAAAAKSHSDESKKTLRSRVYIFVAAASLPGLLVRGVTCDEAEAFLGLSHQTVSARFTELRDAGLIEETGDRRPTRSGRAAAVYVTTTKS